MKGTYRKGFLVYAGDKLHRSARPDGLRVRGRIVSATLAQADGTPIKIKNRENAVSIKYPNVVSGKHGFFHAPFVCLYLHMEFRLCNSTDV